MKDLYCYVENAWNEFYSTPPVKIFSEKMLGKSGIPIEYWLLLVQHPNIVK
jgi:hypothetical protein